MRRTLGLVGVVTTLIVLLTAWRANTPNPALPGAWTVTSWEIEGEAVPEPQPGLIVFTDTHYSMMYVNVGTLRARYTGDEMTDAERTAAYKTLTANSGRYEVSGDQLTTRAYVAKDPNYMGDWPENASVYTFRIDGETLHLQWPTDWPDRRSGTFTKVEGQPAP